MSKQIKIALIAIVVAANVAILGFRASFPPEKLPAAPHKELILNEEQASVVLRWKKADKLPLSTEGIDSYVSNMSWEDSLGDTQGTNGVKLQALNEQQEKDLQAALGGLIKAYTSGSADNLLGYMSGRGQTLSPAIVVELKKLLIADGGAAKTELDVMNDSEVFVRFSQEAGCNAHWSTLVEKTACATVWQSSALEKNPPRPDLGGDFVGTFKNQTRFHHLFLTSDGKATPAQKNSYELFVDMRFVIEHDEEFLREPSPYYVRFGYNDELSKWQPVEMIHVATSSGNSPILLF